MPGPFDDLIPAQKKPSFSGYIPGTPKPRDPLDDASKNQSIINSQQALINAQLEEENKRLKNKADKARYDATGGVDGTEGENKAAALVTNLQSAMNNIRSVTKANPDAAKPSWLEIGASIFGPDAREMAQSETRRDVVGDQFIAIDSALTLATGAAYTPSQLEGYTRSLFPTVSDSPYNIAQKRRKFQQVIEAGRLQAGAKAPNIEQAIAAVDAIYGPAGGNEQDLGIMVDPAKMQDGVIVNPAPNTPRGGLPENTSIRLKLEGQPEGFDRNAYLSGIGLDANKEANLIAGLNAISGKEGLTAEDMIAVYAQVGAPLPNAADFQAQLENARKGARFGAIDSAAAEKAYNDRIAQEKADVNAIAGEAGVSDLAQQGIMLGLGDEAAGVGTALSALLKGENVVDGYTVGRDVERSRLEDARNRTGFLGTAAEIAGGGASFGPASILNTGAQTTRQLVNQGALSGGVTGFGYGEGALGSTLGAAGGAAGGAALTGVLAKGADFVGNRIGARAAERAALNQDGVNAAVAASDEGLIIPRAMVDPRAAVRTTALDGTVAGRPVIDRTMRGVADAVEGRVASLSEGTVIKEAENLGNRIRNVAERDIKASGQRAKASYDKAESLAGDIKVTPERASQAVDNVIAKQSEFAESNAAEISYLQKLKTDLSKDLTVGGLRRQRTKLRKTIAKGDVIFGESEADVLAIMDAAADDIRAGLTAAGKVDAANAFDVADRAYAQRMDFISGTLQKLIGKRNANLSGKEVARRFNALRGKTGDPEGLATFFDKMTKEERDDVSATIADSLGRRADGDFSLALLDKNVQELSRRDMVTMFGEGGAKSLENLQTISKAYDRVKRNTSNTGIGNDWRNVLGSAIFGGAPVLASGSGAVPAAVAATTLASAKVGRDYVSARMVMSPKFQRWLSKAVVARTPEQIANSFKSLRRVAATEPAIAGEVNSLSNYLLQAANDTGPMAAAANSNQTGTSERSQTARTTEAPR